MIDFYTFSIRSTIYSSSSKLNWNLSEFILLIIGPIFLLRKVGRNPCLSVAFWAIILLSSCQKPSSKTNQPKILESFENNFAYLFDYDEESAKLIDYEPSIRLTEQILQVLAKDEALADITFVEGKPFAETVRSLALVNASSDTLGYILPPAWPLALWFVLNFDPDLVQELREQQEMQDLNYLVTIDTNLYGKDPINYTKVGFLGFEVIPENSGKFEHVIPILSVALKNPYKGQILRE